MSDSESLLSRWSRLKRASVSPDSGDPGQPTAAAAADAPPAVPAVPAADPASLPPIESIGADSDIRSFLEPGVPEELTRAALRSAWTADPAIRDFIGIAENQWDFNGEATIPGFGSLGAEDAALSLLARASVGADAANERAEDSSATEEHTAPASADPHGEHPAGERDMVESRSQETACPEASVAPPVTRRHGSALPD